MKSCDSAQIRFDRMMRREDCWIYLVSNKSQARMRVKLIDTDHPDFKSFISIMEKREDYLVIF